MLRITFRPARLISIVGILVAVLAGPPLAQGMIDPLPRHKPPEHVPRRRRGPRRKLFFGSVHRAEEVAFKKVFQLGPDLEGGDLRSCHDGFSSW